MTQFSEMIKASELFSFKFTSCFHFLFSVFLLRLMAVLASRSGAVLQVVVAQIQ